MNSNENKKSDGADWNWSLIKTAKNLWSWGNVIYVLKFLMFFYRKINSIIEVELFVSRWFLLCLFAIFEIHLFRRKIHALKLLLDWPLFEQIWINVILWKIYIVIFFLMILKITNTLHLLILILNNLIRIYDVDLLILLFYLRNEAILRLILSSFLSVS